MSPDVGCSISEVIGEVTRAVISATTEDDIRQRSCAQLAASQLYPFAWVGRYIPEKEKVSPTASAGIAEQTLTGTTRTEESLRAALTDEAIRTRKVAVRQNLVDDPPFNEWRDHALTHDYQAYAAIPLVHDETLHGVLHLATDRPQGFGQPERELLAELGITIAYALGNVETSVNTERTEREEAGANVVKPTDDSKHERRLYETIISSTPDLVYAFDLDYRFIFANDALLEMWNMSLEESMGKTLLEIGYEPWHAEMHEREIDQVIETTEPIRGEVGFEHAELGHRVYDYIFAPVLNNEGEVEAIAGTTRDITERKETEEELQKSEERFRALVNASSDVVYRMSPDWSEMYHLEGQEFIADTDEPTSRWLNKYILPDDQEHVLDAVNEAIETKSIFEAEHRVKQDDGSLGWTISRAVPRLDEDGEIIEWVGMAKDITKRKEREQKLKKSNERLEQFAYAASHDLQEPLRMVSSYLQLLEKRYADELDEDGEEFIDYAVNGADRMREMIEGLLQYSRVESQGEPFEPVDLESVFGEVRDDLQFRIEESGADISCDSLPTVSGDKNQLREVFQNLLDNAIKYSGDAPPKVQVRADRDGDRWTITIEDNGIGIDPGNQDRVFQVFQRLHAREEHDGTGIGLALCQRIIERHGGGISIDSKPKEGTAFSFTLPATDT